MKRYPRGGRPAVRITAPKSLEAMKHAPALASGWELVTLNEKTGAAQLRHPGISGTLPFEEGEYQVIDTPTEGN